MRMARPASMPALSASESVQASRASAIVCSVVPTTGTRINSCTGSGPNQPRSRPRLPAAISATLPSTTQPRRSPDHAHPTDRNTLADVPSTPKNKISSPMTNNGHHEFHRRPEDAKQERLAADAAGADNGPTTAAARIPDSPSAPRHRPIRRSVAESTCRTFRMASANVAPPLTRSATCAMLPPIGRAADAGLTLQRGPHIHTRPQ